MKNLVLIFITVLFSTTGFAGLAERICSPGVTSATLVSDWTKNTNDNDLCARAICKVDGKDIPRKKCIREQEEGKENTIRVFYQDDIITPNSVTMKGQGYRIIINPQDECFSACEPKKKMFGQESGLKRKTCVECFKARSDTVYDESFEYPEIGRRLYPGTKCHELCRDKEGPISMQRQLTPACQQCVGINGLVSESFQFMTVSSGRCFEVDKDNKYRLVDNQFCHNEDELIHTTFEIDKTWTELFTGGKGRCLELDDKTYGGIYKVSAEMSKCDSSAVNSSDRNGVSEKESSSPSRTSTSNGSSNQ